MKKRILAALVAVAMLAGICTFASAETEVANTEATPAVTAEATPAADEVVLVYEEDFEAATPAPIWSNFDVTTDPADPLNKVLSRTSTDYQRQVSDFLPIECDPATVYTIQLSVYGDIASVGLSPNNPWDFVRVTAGDVTKNNIVGIDSNYDTVYDRPLENSWNTWVVTFTGVTKIKLGVVAQGSYGVNNSTACIDDIKIWKGDAMEMLTATPTPVATTAPTAAVTVTPSSTATAALSASATVDTGKTDDNGTTAAKKSIKFKKKKVTIKKGKKATLKVTIKGAKKAKFSVNKKGKKVVKLSKKKAKSVVVSGKKKGKATITAKAAGKKATCKVTVK